MTNYEWLVKNENLAEFIFDVVTYYHQCTKIGPTVIDANNFIKDEKIDLKEKYGITFKTGQRISQKIADWLEEKHLEERR